jgi:hypothetical protein
MNHGLPGWMQLPRPEPASRFIQYARLIQDWRMFAPDVTQIERIIAVEALTIDGRTVDPFTEVATRYDRIPLDDSDTSNRRGYAHGLPERLSMSQPFAAYSLGMTKTKFSGFLPALGVWIWNYHERTGNPEDRIVRYQVYRLKDRTPTPGTDESPQITRTLIDQHPKPSPAR